MIQLELCANKILRCYHHLHSSIVNYSFFTIHVCYVAYGVLEPRTKLMRSRARKLQTLQEHMLRVPV